MIATAKCPRCGHANELTACQNCGGTDFRRGPLSDGTTGMICNGCNRGFSEILCQAGCGTLVPATAFGTPLSKIAERAQKGMDAHQGTGGCFIATELYGGGSGEVAVLRRLRDEALLQHALGQRFVTFYYRFAPRIVPVMRRSIVVRRLLHGAVALAVFGVRRALDLRAQGAAASGSSSRQTASPPS